MSVFLNVILILLVVFLLYRLRQQSKRLARYQGITDIEAEQVRLQKEIAEFEAELERIKRESVQNSQELSDLKQQIVTKKAELDKAIADVEVQDFGIYDPKYDFGPSETYKERLKLVRERQKTMIKLDEAIEGGDGWTVNGDEKKGKKMIDEQKKLMLRAFNGECDSIIDKVKWNNVERIEQRLVKTKAAIDKLSKSKRVSLSPKYLALKVSELHLVHEYNLKVHEDREEQREIKEQMREEERARREIEKARTDAEKETRRYEKALAAAREEMEKATGAEKDALTAQLESLQQQLDEANAKGERAMSRAQMTRSGHVYVISNIGSFGENIYKIGMTRRLEPMDRVKELGDASVPFSFDVHAIIYSDDAPKLESTLHKQFADKRVNKINLRKEFFNVSLDDIQGVVHEQNDEIEFTLVAQAAEYRETLALRQPQAALAGD